MKKTIVSAIAVCFISTPTFAGDLLYGSCRPVKDATFYRCVSIDDQITYTNVLPSAEMLSAYKRARQLKDQDRSRRSGRVTVLKKTEFGKTEVTVEAPGNVRIIEQVNRCNDLGNEFRAQAEAWDRQLEQLIKGDRMAMPEMDRIEKSIGRLAGACLGK